MPSVSPLHDTTKNIETITIKDVSNPSTQNINPLTAEDLKKILDQSTLQAKLYENLLLVSVEELKKVVIEVTREKVHTQEQGTIQVMVIDQGKLEKNGKTPKVKE